MYNTGIMKRSRMFILVLVCAVAVCSGEIDFSDIVMNDDFNSRPLGALSADGGWSYVDPKSINTKRFLKVTADTGDIFGEGSANHYLSITNGADNPGSYITEAVASGIAGFDDSSVHLSFDFCEKSGQTNRLAVYMGEGDSADNAVNKFELDDGSIYPGGGSYSMGAAHHLDVFYNESGSDIHYVDPVSTTSTLSTGFMDIWLDDVRVGAGVSYSRSGSPASTMNSVKLTTDTVNQNIFIDNFTIATEYIPPLVIDSISESNGNIRLSWNIPEDRFIVEGGNTVEALADNALKQCCASSEGISTNKIKFPFAGDSGYFRIRKGIQAVDGFSDLNFRAIIKVDSQVEDAPANRVYEVEISGMTGLNVDDCDIADFAGINKITGLTYFSAAGNPAGEIIETVEGLNQLETLDIGDSQIMNLSAISNLAPLTALDLSENSIVDISSLETLSNLTVLSVRDNSITDGSPLSNLVNLVWLDISENELTDLDFASGLSAIEWMGLNGNRLTNVTGLAACSGLDQLNLANNDLVDLSGIDSLTGLTRLNLSSNNLSNIDELTSLDLLQTLDLSGNQLVDIDSVSGLEHLRWLNLDDNNVTDLSGVLSNAVAGGLGDGDMLSVKNNPLGQNAVTNQIPELEDSYNITVFQ